jgi:hypothetical protein
MALLRGNRIHVDRKLKLLRKRASITLFLLKTVNLYYHTAIRVTSMRRYRFCVEIVKFNWKLSGDGNFWSVSILNKN